MPLVVIMCLYVTAASGPGLWVQASRPTTQGPKCWRDRVLGPGLGVRRPLALEAPVQPMTPGTHTLIHCRQGSANLLRRYSSLPVTTTNIMPEGPDYRALCRSYTEPNNALVVVGYRRARAGFADRWEVNSSRHASDNSSTCTAP